MIPLLLSMLLRQESFCYGRVVQTVMKMPTRLADVGQPRHIHGSYVHQQSRRFAPSSDPRPVVLDFSSFDNTGYPPPSHSATFLNFSHDGRFCVTMTEVTKHEIDKGTLIEVWNLSTMKVVLSHLDSGLVFSTWFSPQSDHLAVISDRIVNSQIVVWKLNQGAPIAKVSIPPGPYCEFNPSPEGSLLAVGRVFPGSRTGHSAYERTFFKGITLVDAKTWKVLHQPASMGGTNPQNSKPSHWGSLDDDSFVTFLPNKPWMVTLPSDGRGAYHLWDIETGQAVSAKKYNDLLATLEMNLCDFSGEDSYIAGPQTEYRRQIEIYNLKNGRLIKRLPTPSAYGMNYYDVIVSKKRDRMLVCDSILNKVQLFRTSTGAHVMTFQDFPDIMTSKSSADARVVFSIDGRYIFSYAAGGTTIFVRDAATGRLIHKFTSNHDSINRITLSPDGKWAAVMVDETANMYLWRIRDLVGRSN